MFRARTVAFTIACIALALTPATAGEGPVGVSAGYEAPESAAWDADSGAWYVSSKGGTGFGGGTAGYISKVSATGVVLAERWVSDDVDSPFGVDVHDGKLYASDGGVVRVIDIATAQVVQTIPVTNAGLNDLEVDAATGDVYVSGAGMVQRIGAGEEMGVPFITEGLGQPNGLLVEDGTLYVASLSSDAGLGRVFAVDLETLAITPFTEPIGILDGIVRHGEDFIISDFVTGRIMRVAPDGSVTLQYPLPPSAADIGIDPATDRIAVPITVPNITLILPA